MEINAPALVDIAAMGDVTDPAARLVQRVQNALASAAQRIDDAYGRWHDNEPAVVLIFVRPTGQVQFAIGVGEGENARAVKFVKNFTRDERAKVLGIGWLSLNVPHGSQLLRHDGKQVDSIDAFISPPGCVRRLLPRGQL
ncbi:MAG TPA: hypothetical protein VJ783_27545 [Pirellulales bacterium]|nr:hypothetical protein [Pirellulales bacterium]